MSKTVNFDIMWASIEIYYPILYYYVRVSSDVCRKFQFKILQKHIILKSEIQY